MSLPATDPAGLLKAAKLFHGIPDGYQLAVQSYLLATLAGLDTSSPAAVAAILKAACNFTCLPSGDQLAVENYLLSLLVS